MTVKSVEAQLQMQALIGQLRKKVENFTVKDLEGSPIGKVQDLQPGSDRHLKLIIFQQPETQENSGYFALSSKYIQRIDAASQSLFVDFANAEIETLSEYKSTNNLNSNIDTPEGNYVDTDLSEQETPEILQEEVIRLLEERLVIDRKRRKVGDVVVRKEIETRIVEVPVQREKLIVEQVSPEYKQLAVIDLGGGEVTGLELIQPSETDKLTASKSWNSQRAVSQESTSQPTVSGEFRSPKAASLLLDSIALQKQHGCAKVRVEIILDNPELQETYQKMFDRCSGRNLDKS